MTEYLLAQKIKDLRLKQNMTIEEVAQRTNLSKSLISKIENNKTSPPIATLMNISKALNVHIGYFFGENPEKESAIVSREGKRTSFIREKNGIMQLFEPLALELSDAAGQPFIITATSKISSSTRKEFDHHNSEEFIYILEGTIEIVFETGQTYKLAKGDSLYFNANVPHHVNLIKSQPAKWLVTLLNKEKTKRLI